MLSFTFEDNRILLFKIGYIKKRKPDESHRVYIDYYVFLVYSQTGFSVSSIGVAISLSTRILPQYSQTIIFFLDAMSN